MTRQFQMRFNERMVMNIQCLGMLREQLPQGVITQTDAYIAQHVSTLKGEHPHGSERFWGYFDFPIETVLYQEAIIWITGGNEAPKCRTYRFCVN